MQYRKLTNICRYTCNTKCNIHTAPNKTHSPSLQSRSTIISCVCLCMSPSSLPWVLSPPQLVSTFPPLHIPLLTITRSPSTFFSSLFPMTLALFLSRSFCYIDILSPPLYWDTPLTAPPVTLFMTTDLRGKCKVPPHQEIKTLASSRCLTPLTSLIFPHPFLHTPLPKSPLYHILFSFSSLQPALANTVLLLFYLSHHIVHAKTIIFIF